MTFNGLMAPYDNRKTTRSISLKTKKYSCLLNFKVLEFRLIHFRSNLITYL